MISPIEIKPSLKTIGDPIPEPPDFLEEGQARTEFNILFEDHLGNRIMQLQIMHSFIDRFLSTHILRCAYYKPVSGNNQWYRSVVSSEFEWAQ